ncbi:MAG: hypothetical protein WBA99_04630 [Nodosilinea sp.]
MDLQSIQTKLIHRVNAFGQSEGNVQVDWATSPPPSDSGGVEGTRPRANFSAAVETLKRRADQNEDGNGSMAGSGGAVEGFTQQLNAIAYKINQLSVEQERAIAEMQVVQAHLVQIYPRADHRGQPLTPPYLDSQRAVIASVEVDGWGNVVLAYRTVAANVLPPNGSTRRSRTNQTYPLADSARSRFTPSPARGVWNSLVSDVETLGHEPVHLLAHLGRTLWELGLDVARRAMPNPARPQLARRTSGQRPRGAGPNRSIESLSLVDSLLWFGGGVIGRLALNLLIGAFPALWSLAVAAITAMTAYALYRATLAPKLTFGPALRVALAVVGLIVGGQL